MQPLISIVPSNVVIAHWTVVVYIFQTLHDKWDENKTIKKSGMKLCNLPVCPSELVISQIFAFWLGKFKCQETEEV